jgi:hypothetical protein
VDFSEGTRTTSTLPQEVVATLPGGPAPLPSGPTCDAELPRKIRVDVPQPEADLRLQVRQATWNPSLSAETFAQPVPEGMGVESVVCEDR